MIRPAFRRVNKGLRETGLKIEVYSHNFCVTEMSRDERIAIDNYTKRNLISKKMEYEGGRKIWVPDKEFFSHDDDCTYVRFHINLANEFLQAMAYYQIPKSNIKVVRYTPLADERFKVNLELKKLWDPREHQVKCINHIEEPGSNKIINLMAGGGKGQPLDSPIRVPGGWSTMGEMYPGRMILDRFGITQVVTGVYPQGVKDVYRVWLADSRFTEVDDTHLWKVRLESVGTEVVIGTLDLKRLVERGDKLILPDTLLYPTTDAQRTVRAVVFIRKDRTQCISVSGDEKLYVTAHHIVTHNTEIAKHIMYRSQLRTAGFMKSSYIDRWIPDLNDSFHYGKGELLHIAGSAAINSVMEMALDGEDVGKTLFFSTNSLGEWFKSFESDGVTSMYPIAPIDLFHKLGIGFVALDEGHQFPHLIMKLFTYTHVHKFVTLSGTLDTQEPFKDRIRNVMYPKTQRFTADYNNKYVVVTAAMYQLKVPNSIHCTQRGAYSHVKFEESLMLAKNKRMLANYLDLIEYYFDYKFASVREGGQKALIFCATMKFVGVVLKHLKKKHPSLDIRQYLSTDKKKDKDDAMANATVLVSTVLSCGTAVDIPNLRWGFLTIALDSQESNEQALLRTRPLKDFPDTEAEFTYLVCQGIQKHVDYHRRKQEFFAHRAKRHVIDMSPVSV